MIVMIARLEGYAVGFIDDERRIGRAAQYVPARLC